MASTTPASPSAETRVRPDGDASQYKPQLLPGESMLLSIDAVDLTKPALQGTLTLTDYRVIFWIPSPAFVAHTVQTPVMAIQSAKTSTNPERRIPNYNPSTPSPLTKEFNVCLTIKCKYNLVHYYAVPSSHRNKDEFFTKLHAYIAPKTLEQCFAFRYRPPEFPNKIDGEIDEGWRIYDAVAEFSRLGILNPCSSWRITEANKDYKICPSYPSYLVVPNALTDEDLARIAEFRSKGRLPVLSYKHSFNQATITRCSQPLAGIRIGKRCREDEMMITAIREANPNDCPLYILDLRPKVNAVANAAFNGAGYEGKLYKHCELQFLGIGNIHIMRDSFKRLRGVCANASDPHWFASLETTGWLDHIRQLLDCAIYVAKLIELRGASVLLHCSDGWDRTAQVVSLAELLLDPFYRTLKGFQILIEKEWLSFGHKFSERHGHSEAHFQNKSQQGPIFLQWLDAVWQLLQQFPCSFEFNERFLVDIADAAFSCRFGTFLGSSERERRVVLKAPSRTLSLWSHMALHLEHYLNPFFDTGKAEQGLVLVPNLSPGRIMLWSGYHMRGHRAWNNGYIRIGFRTYIVADEKPSEVAVEYLKWRRLAKEKEAVDAESKNKEKKNVQSSPVAERHEESPSIADSVEEIPPVRETPAVAPVVSGDNEDE